MRKSGIICWLFVCGLFLFSCIHLFLLSGNSSITIPRKAKVTLDERSFHLSNSSAHSGVSSEGSGETKGNNPGNDDFGSIQTGFLKPADSVRISAFYYWLNNHISKDGVSKDLLAMKKAGITRVFIGTNIRNRTDWSRDTTGKWFGKISVFSDQWWDVLHTALKMASDLKMEVGLFNCPGWSQSGGPWVKREQAMRYLDASEIKVKGPARISTYLTKTDSFFQDVRVLAIRTPAGYEKNVLDEPGVKLTSSDLHINPSVRSNESKYILTEKESILQIELPRETTVRSMTFHPADYLNVTVDIQAKVDTGFRSLQTVEIIRSRTVEDLAKGFEPHAPFYLPLDHVTAKSFRVIFRKNGKETSQISNIAMSATPVVRHLLEKKLAKVVASAPSWTGSKNQTGTKQIENGSLPGTKDVLDISQHMASNGLLNWNAPKGDWLIMRIGMRFIDVQNGPASFEAEGLEVDKMNRKHVQSHFNSFIGEILRRIPSIDRRALKMVVMDSYERGGFNFTDGFLDEFKMRYGYDAMPYLPVYRGHMIGSPEISDRFLWDIRRMVADKLSYDYVGGMTEISHRYGLRTWIENYGHSGFPGEFLQYGGQADEVAGEYWVEPISNRRFENRAAASAAHIYGKRKVWSESFTSGSWTKNFGYATYPQELKSLGDWAFTQGVNSTVFHVYIQQPYEEIYPGVDAWFGTEFNRKNTWFPHMDLFTLYHRRCNFMLQQGINVADVAYYIGEDNPMMRGLLEPALPGGFNYDFINAEIIFRYMKVKNGRFELPNGTSYRVLVLPEHETMRPQLLRRIAQLVSAGGVVLGAPPSRSPSLQNYPHADNTVQQLARQLWGDGSQKQRAYGKGIVFNGGSLEQVLQALNVDADFLSGNDSISYTHRTLNGKEIYFIANSTGKPVQFSAAFRVTGLEPELWDPLSGTIRLLPDWKQDANSVTIPLKLEAHGSAFIVFRRQNTTSIQKGGSNFPEPTLVCAVHGPWQIRFDHDSIRRGPNEPVVLHQLKDWSEFDDERIRYYSGTALYSTSFTMNGISKEKAYYLDLGSVTATAKVKVNGNYVGGVWTYPFRLNVSDVVRSGTNTLEVEVINTWKNRLTGDQRLPGKDRLVYSRINPWNGDSTLQKSGLLGPVTLSSVDKQ